ncbi:MAG TPA: YqgQ family protein [Pseudogracilibacillus sp.]|nr:YqgQ family protein [Pseudogracilibacillus sp.]
MHSVYDVQKLLKRFGIFVYTGERNIDLSMMKWELRDLFDNKMIDVMTYQTAIHILNKAIKK